jgi:hypothetical protein
MSEAETRPRTNVKLGSKERIIKTAHTGAAVVEVW